MEHVKNRVMIFSAQWPGFARSGLGVMALLHARFLVELGFNVCAVGTDSSVEEFTGELDSVYQVMCKGSGALYSPEKTDENKICHIINSENPDIIIVEAWQNSLAHSVLKLACDFKIPVIVISHGVNLFPATFRILNIIRSLCWMPYLFSRLPKLIKKARLVSSLSLTSSDLRFLDRRIAEKLNVDVYKLANCAFNHRLEKRLTFSERKKQVILIGYFGEVKNQIAAIKMMAGISGIALRLVGNKDGSYFKKCRNLVEKLKISDRVYFSNDKEIDLPLEIASSLALISTSSTEALPVSVLEAIAVGTPFVSYRNGCINEIEGGITVSKNNPKVLSRELSSIIADEMLWNRVSDAGYKFYGRSFSREIIKNQFRVIVETALNERTKNGR